MIRIKYRRDLWQILEHLKGDAAEIGVAEGFFSAEMLAWPIRLPRVYLVDRWRCVSAQRGDASNPQAWHDKNRREAIERVAPYTGRAIFLQGDSVGASISVPDESLRLVYIDADHSYEGVTNDIHAWRPKLVPGGIMAFHDYQAPQYGVQKAVKDYCRLHELPIFDIPEDKPEDAGAYYVNLV